MCISWFLLWPAPGFASPSSALREYKAGQYDQALKEYERLLQKKSDDPRLHFNAGAAAYRNQQFDEAAKQFNATLASPDLKLQGLAYYNEGNALYHLGERNPDPKQAHGVLGESRSRITRARMKLNPQDADAKFNYEFVKQKLEELKQQQQQQQQSQQDKQDQKQNQDQQQQQEDQNQQKQDQQKQQDQQQQQISSKPSRIRSRIHPSRSRPSSRRSRKSKSRPPSNPSSRSKISSRRNSRPASPRTKPTRRSRKPQQAQALAQMTPEQAQQLLDAQKGDEKMLPPQPTGKPVDRSRPIKDW